MSDIVHDTWVYGERVSVSRDFGDEMYAAAVEHLEAKKRDGLAAIKARGVDYASRGEWLIGRKAGIGASDSPALFRVGYANQSPVSVYESKISEVRPENKDVSLQRRLRIGKQMEPVLREIFRDETGLDVHDAGEFCVYHMPELPFITATLDGLCWNPELEEWCIVELKNVAAFMREEWADGAPLMYQVQVQQQLAVTGLKHAYILGLIGGQDPVVKEIERNDHFIEDILLPKLREFWGYVESRTLPPVDGSDATSKALSRIFDEDSGEEVMLPEQAEHWDAELTMIKAEIKQKTERKAELENWIKAHMKDASVGFLPTQGRFTWRLEERSGYEVKPTTVRILRRSAK